MDEVEIKNVGGRSGVASEVTLQRLLEATTQNSTNATAAARTRQRLVETSNKAEKDKTSTLKNATGAVKGLAKEFVSGGNRVSDFSGHILGASSRLQNLVEYLDDNVDQFRSLSQVGAGFNNSIFDMMKSAGLSAMRMDEYYRVVQDNSEVLRMLGGTVTQGAKEFGQLSRSMRQGDLGDRLFDLGFTISDVNDGLMNYIQVQALQGRLQGMSQRDLIAGSQDYLVEIDKLSKATGLSRDALLDQQKELGNNAKFQALLSRASADGADNLSKNIGTIAQMLGPQFADDLSLIAGGEGGMSDLYKGLIASGEAGQKFAGILENAGSMTDEQFLTAIQQAGPEVAEALKGFTGGTQAGLQRGGVALAALFDNIGQFQSMQNIDPQAAARQASAQDNVTDFLTSFGNQLQQVKTNVLDAIINSDFGTSMSALSTSLGTALTSLFGEGDSGASGAFGSLSDGISAAVDKLTGPEGYLTKLTNTIRGEVEAFTAATSPNASNRQSPMDYLRQRAGELGTQLKNWFTDMFLGPINDEMGMSRSGGILGTIKTGFSNLMSAAYDKILTLAGFDTNESIYDQLKAKVFGTSDSEGNVEGGMAQRLADGLSAALATAAEGMQLFGDSDLGRKLLEDLDILFKKIMLSLMEAINESGIFGDMAISDERIDELKTATGQADAGVLARNRSRDLQRAQEMAANERLAMSGFRVEGSRETQAYFAEVNARTSRRVGTLRATGKTAEPSDTVANIHKGERVLNPSETAAVNDLPGAINQLNTLTAQIRDLMSQSVAHQERTARGIKKLGSDLMA